MLISEIVINGELIRKPKTQMFPHTWVAVPRGTLWQRDLHGLWLFKTLEEAQTAATKPAARHVLDQLGNCYLVPVKARNKTCALMAIRDHAYGDLRNWSREYLGTPELPVMAIALTESSAWKAATEAASKIEVGFQMWVYRSWNMDPSVFDIDPEEIEHAA